MKRLLGMLALMLCLTSSMYAQTVSGEWGGTVQVRMGYTPHVASSDEALNLDARRIRARGKVRAGERWTLFAQAEGAHFDLRMLDLRLTYHISEHLALQAGRMVVAQPAAYATTTHFTIDALERPGSTRAWAKGSFSSDGRDTGVQALWQRDGTTARIAWHQGLGRWRDAWSDLPGQLSFAIRHQLAPEADWDIGLYASQRLYGLQTDATGGQWGKAWAAHLYWGALPGSQPMRFKLDVLGAQSLSATTLGQMRGVSVLGARSIGRALEWFGRGERIVRETNAGHNLPSQFLATTGLSLSPSAWRGGAFSRERLTLSWECEYTDDNGWNGHVLVLQAQWVF